MADPVASSYPPEHHVLRDLLTTSVWVSEDELHVYAPAQPAAMGPIGLDVGVMAAIIDGASAQVVMRAIDGDWCATTDLSYQRSGELVDGPMVVSARLLRSGDKVVTARCEVFDGRGEERPARHVGSGVATFARIARESAAHAIAYEGAAPIGERVSISTATSGFTVQPARAVGLAEIEPGVLEMGKSGYVENSFGTVNGGATAIALAAAAESAVPGAAASDISINYVGRAGVGPLRTTAREMADYGSYVSVDVELFDTSEQDRSIATATVGLARE